MISKDDFSIFKFSDGTACLECRKDCGMDFDLVFVVEAKQGDPLFDEQRAILEFILKSIQIN